MVAKAITFHKSSFPMQFIGACEVNGAIYCKYIPKLEETDLNIWRKLLVFMVPI